MLVLHLLLEGSRSVLILFVIENVHFRGRAFKRSFQLTCDELASKICVPLDLLMIGSKKYPAESRIRLNIYCSELVHALCLAEQSDVPSRLV